MTRRRKPAESRQSIEDPSIPLSSPAAYDMLATRPSTSSIPVNRITVLGYPAVFRGISLISAKVGKLNLNVYKRGKDGGRVVDDEHPANWLLTRRPSSLYTPFVWKSCMQSHCLLFGNAFSIIYRDAYSRPEELIIVDPQQTFPVMEGGRLSYITQIGSERIRIASDDMIHLKGLTHDGIVGYSVIDLLREAFGLGLAAQRYGSVFFRNGANPGVTILKVPNVMKDREFVRRLREDWNRMHHGLDNAHKTVLLEGGMEVVPFAMPDHDSLQFLQTRQYEVVQIANILGLPPSRLGAQTNTSYSSLEQEEKSFLNDSLDAHLVQFEEECERKLLTEAQAIRDSHFIEFDRRQLTQSDHRTQSDTLIAEVNNGLRTDNEARALLNLPGIGPDGDRLRCPSNVTFLDMIGTIPEDNPPSDDPGQPAESVGATGGAGSPAAVPTDPEGDVGQRLHSLLSSVIRRQLVRVSKAMTAASTRAGFSPRAVLAAHREVATQAVSPALDCGPDAVASLWGALEAELAAVLPEQVPEVLARQDPGRIARDWLARCGGKGGTPGPCPEGGNDKEAQSKAQDLRDRWQRVFEAKMSGLPEKHQQAYKAQIAQVLGGMSPAGLDRFSANCKKVNLYADRKSLTEALDKEHPNTAFGEALKAGQTVGGCYDGGNGRLSMNGPYYTGEKGWLPPAAGFAHEMTHAIDGPKREISQSPEWKAAHSEAGKIGKYATTKYHESFAEFGRLVHTSGMSRKEIEAAHPKMSAVWEKHGLWN